MRLSVHKHKTRIEIAPLMDVVFILLIFFVYSMFFMSVHRGTSMVLPSSSTAEIEHKASMNISIKNDGSLYIDNRMLTLEQLKSELKEIKSKSDESNISVHVFGDKKLEYQRLYTLLDVLKESGIKKISLQAVK